MLKNEGYQTESFTPPLINPMTVTTANDAMERMPGEDLYSGMTPEERAAKQLIEDYQRLNDAATRREEWMAVRTIMDGQIPVVGPGVNKVIDFGFTNKVKLDGTKKWGDVYKRQAGCFVQNAGPHCRCCRCAAGGGRSRPPHGAGTPAVRAAADQSNGRSAGGR